ncbi:WYL domain-containing protein [Roseovarius rhodophyticola]|uniref:WYL domain-containing protein n=1 Tax=Roseovarius rhodophyticola TaxID=3080827 RepID=A0ABZ2TLF4_9RHOB|nr:WYL domain-containing protein [Roseovarius sp. W115]MDV2927894.1 WYL domain-containing protein [Roseovarius sp. W115]
MAFDDLKHAQKERLEYLDRLLFWDGAATRGSLIERFRISNPQAALDFKTYLQAAKPAGLEYDASSRQYLTTEHFSRLTGRAATDELEELLSGKKRAFYDVLPDLQRTQNVRVFRPLYRAMLAGEAIKIVYQSMRDPEPETRWIAPLRFASDGVRLHLRAWCYTRQGFRDFIPSRIDPTQSFAERRNADGVPRDDDWYTWAVLKLRPHGDLTQDQKRVVRIEFGFDDECLEIRVRKPLEFYTKRRWGLDQENPRLECFGCEYVAMSEEEIDED